MTRPTIASLLGSAPVALATDFAQHLLTTALPTEAEIEAAVKGGTIAAAPERFTIQRGVAVVPIRGFLTFDNPFLERYLGWTTFQGLVETMDELRANTDVGAVAMPVNSPGGFVTGIAAAAEAIAACAAVKPVHALVHPLAASGGYWLASQAREISVTPGGVVGSIGVAVMASSPVQPGMHGEQAYVLTSTHARAKRPDPSTEAGRAELQRSLDDAEKRFHAAVAAGRGIDPEALAAQLSVTDDPLDGGATFEADDAIARGLADRQETRTAFYDRIFGAYAPQPRKVASRGYAARAAAAMATASL